MNDIAKNSSSTVELKKYLDCNTGKKNNNKKVVVFGSLGHHVKQKYFNANRYKQLQMYSSWLVPSEK